MIAELRTGERLTVHRLNDEVGARIRVPETG